VAIPLEHIKRRTFGDPLTVSITGTPKTTNVGTIDVATLADGGVDKDTSAYPRL
jgi:hypothetical protein